MESDGQSKQELLSELAKLREEVKLLQQTEVDLQSTNRTISHRLDILSTETLDILIEVDSNKVYVWANAMGYQFFGDDVIGKEAAVFFEGDQEVYTTVEPLFEGDDNTMYLESWQRRRDGEIRLLAWWCRPLKDSDGNVTGALSTARDVTEQRTSFKREFFATRIFGQLPVKANYRETIKTIISEIREFTGFEAVSIRIKDHNDFPYFETTGFSDLFVETERFLCSYAEGGEILKDEKGIPILDCICGSVVRGRTDETQPFFTSGGSFWTNSTTDVIEDSEEGSLPARTRHRCNQEGYESVALIPLKTGDTIIGLLQFNDHRRDCFTEELICYFERIASSLGGAIVRVQVEEDLAEANIKLSEALSKLKESQEHLIQTERLSAVGRMASGIAHDFNNTLMPIVSLSDLLVQEPDMLADKKESLAMLKQISSAANDARQIVKNLRLAYKGDAKSENHKLVDVNDVIGIALGFAESVWRKRKRSRTRISSRVDFGVVPLIMGNDVELREAVMNLVFNAADAMPDGGILSASTYAAGDFVVIDVTDTGKGMTEEEQARCLEPFFTTKGPKGTGIGLSMVNGIVSSHGGKLEIKSEPGVGTTISVRFPACKDDQVRDIKDSVAFDPVLGKRILVVDDDERSREILTSLLSSDRHKVDTFSTGVDAVRSIRKKEYDLIITDFMMDGLDGFGVSRAAKEHNLNLPVIIVTGVSDQIEENGDDLAFVNLVLAKPVTKDSLRRSVASVLSV